MLIGCMYVVRVRVFFIVVNHNIIDCVYVLGQFINIDDYLTKVFSLLRSDY
jgi:hypothetical protein